MEGSRSVQSTAIFHDLHFSEGARTSYIVAGPDRKQTNVGFVERLFPEIFSDLKRL